MIVQLSPQFKFVCERCGKEILIQDSRYIHTVGKEVKFTEGTNDLFKMPKEKNGCVCDECLEDFRNLAENFFDEVNKGGEG